MQNRDNATDKLDLGIIGVGHLGCIHARLAAQSDLINLVGVYDLDPERAASVGDSCHTRAFGTMDELLQHCRAVCIVVPTSQHHAVALQALERDCHVFLEKPIAPTVDEARDIVRKAREREKKLQIGHIERFNPAMLAIKDHSLAPMFIEAHRLSEFNPRGCDVSVVLDLMIHDLDHVLYIVQSPVTAVHACGVGVVSDSEDIANVRITFASGCVANLTSSRISLTAMRKMRLFQKNQYISMDFLEKKTDIFKLQDPETSPDPGDFSMVVSQIGTEDKTRNIVYEKPAIPEVNSLQLEVEEFARAVLLDQEPEVTGEQGVRVLETATRILEHIERG